MVQQEIGEKNRGTDRLSGAARSKGKRTYLLITKTVDGVVIDHAHGLHEGVADFRADKGEAPLLQVSTQ